MSCCWPGANESMVVVVINDGSWPMTVCLSFPLLQTEVKAGNVVTSILPVGYLCGKMVCVKYSSTFDGRERETSHCFFFFVLNCNTNTRSTWAVLEQNLFWRLRNMLGLIASPCKRYGRDEDKSISALQNIMPYRLLNAMKR